MKGEAVIFILLLNRLGAALIKIEIAASCMNKSVMYKKTLILDLGDIKVKKQRIVVKIGSSSLADSHEGISKEQLSDHVAALGSIERGRA